MAILNFAEQHWCKVLHIAHLRSGESSIEWQQGLEILDRLLEVVGFEASTRSKTAVAKVLNDIRVAPRAYLHRRPAAGRSDGTPTIYIDPSPTGQCQGHCY